MFHVAILVWVIGTGGVWTMGRVGIRDCCVSFCTCGCVAGLDICFVVEYCAEVWVLALVYGRQRIHRED